MPNPNPKTEQIEAHQAPPSEIELGKVIGTRYPLAVQSVLDGMPEKQAFIRQAVEEKLNANTRSPGSPRPHPETDLQTLTTLSLKECSFVANGKLQTGAIAAVLINWKTGKVSAVLINTANSQMQLPIAKVTILS